MIDPDKVVSIHPYFKVHPGKLDEFKASLPAFLERVATEKNNLYYDFTICGDEVFCREAYIGADGMLEHLANVGQLLEPLMKLADLMRVEVHGPAAELEKLKEPLADLNPVWYTYLFGVKAFCK
jgi:quinol monooxygenase YgiN